MPNKAICVYVYSYTLYFTMSYTLRYYWFYGDVSDVVLWAPLWIDMYRGRIVGLILYPRRGWCGWRFNHDGWVKWRCHDIATWLTQANTSAGYKNDVFLLHVI